MGANNGEATLPLGLQNQARTLLAERSRSDLLFFDTRRNGSFEERLDPEVVDCNGSDTGSGQIGGHYRLVLDSLLMQRASSFLCSLFFRQAAFAHRDRPRHAPDKKKALMRDLVAPGNRT